MQSVKLQFDQKDDYRIKEAFKTLRSNIEFSGSDIRVIAITSCTPNEGKSSVAMEVAKSFAEAGSRTILIDADMRKSVLVGRYKTGAVRKGLSQTLIGRTTLEDAICETNLDNLYMIFAGPVPPNPSELLGDALFGEILEKLKKVFDYIIVDTPPLGSVIDAAVVAKRCNGTIIVVENNAVSYRFVQKVKEQLDKTESRILGVVLNKVNLNSKGYYGHYGRYYGKYYGQYYGNYGAENKEGGEEAKPESKDENRAETRTDSRSEIKADKKIPQNAVQSDKTISRINAIDELDELDELDEIDELDLDILDEEA